MVNVQLKDSAVSVRAGVTGTSANPAYSGIRDVLTSVYKVGGIRGLYRGVGMCYLEFFSMSIAFWLLVCSFSVPKLSCTFCAQCPLLLCNGSLSYE